jgi:chromosome segregation ATPase
MELHKIEKSTGMSYKEILAKASDCQMKLEQAKKHLSATHEDYSQLKQKLNKIQQQEVKAENQLKEKLDQLGLNFSRLSKIENLALALKKAGITNVQLDAYLKLQELLNNAGIPINVLVEIVYAVQGSPGADGGKSLLEKIKEHNGLEVSISSLKQEEQALTQKVAGLEEKAKIKGELQTQVTNLQVQKKEREGEISVLTIQYKQLSDAVATLKTQEAQLVKQADALETGIEEKRKHVQQLDLEIENKQKKVVDFADIEAKREILLHELAEAEESIKNITFERNIVKAFMGLVQKQSMAELESLYSSMPSMIEKVKKNEYSPALIINFVLRTLGPQTHVLKCESCGIRFTVDKAPTGFEYHCPSGDYGHKTLIEMPSVEVLKSILAPKKITGTIVVKNEPEDGKTA